jgi:abhydrolase domain-containing protein 12
MAELAPIFKKAYWALFIGIAIYAAALIALTNPWLQRQ